LGFKDGDRRGPKVRGGGKTKGNDGEKQRGDIKDQEFGGQKKPIVMEEKGGKKGGKEKTK